MKYPCLKINLKKIAGNCKIINDRCTMEGISVVGVTKGVSGDIHIAQVLKNSGIKILGDSRLSNLKKLRDYFGSSQNLAMLRTPMISEIEDVVKICDVSMNTQLEVVGGISKVCEKCKVEQHNIMVMVETDDRREGLLPEEVIPFCKMVSEKYKNIRIYGLGTNARCMSSKKPSFESMKVLIDLKKKIKDSIGLDIPVISGGNSSIWNLIEIKKMPSEVNQVRIGEAILLGHETAEFKPIKGASLDAFILEAEVIEVKREASDNKKIILALGLADVSYRNIFCRRSDLYIIDQSSDHTVLGVKKSRIKKSDECKRIVKNITNKRLNKAEKEFLNLKVGSIISFNLNYFGLLSCMTSPFVKRKYIEVQ